MNMSQAVDLARILKFLQKLGNVEAKVEYFCEKEDVIEVTLRITIKKGKEYPIDVIRVEVEA